VAVAPFAFGFLVGAPTECCVGAPLHSSLFIVVPAAVVGLVIWHYGRRQPEKP
jgi:hypothetical protein